MDALSPDQADALMLLRIQALQQRLERHDVKRAAETSAALGAWAAQLAARLKRREQQALRRLARWWGRQAARRRWSAGGSAPWWW